MDATRPMLPTEIESQVVMHHGGPVAVSGQQGDHVVMSINVFREMMGVGSDEEFAQSVSALQVSLAQAAAGQTMSLDEAVCRLNRSHGA